MNVALRYVGAAREPRKNNGMKAECAVCKGAPAGYVKTIRTNHGRAQATPRIPVTAAVPGFLCVQS